MSASVQRAKTRQISVRLGSETDAWLERRAGGQRRKAAFVRRLIEEERAREREETQLQMFNEAAEDLTPEDLEERESLVGAFAGEDRRGAGE